MASHQSHNGQPSLKAAAAAILKCAAKSVDGFRDTDVLSGHAFEGFVRREEGPGLGAVALTSISGQNLQSLIFLPGSPSFGFPVENIESPVCSIQPPEMATRARIEINWGGLVFSLCKFANPFSHRVELCAKTSQSFLRNKSICQWLVESFHLAHESSGNLLDLQSWSEALELERLTSCSQSQSSIDSDSVSEQHFMTQLRLATARLLSRPEVASVEFNVFGSELGNHPFDLGPTAYFDFQYAIRPLFYTVHDGNFYEFPLTMPDAFESSSSSSFSSLSDIVIPPIGSASDLVQQPQFAPFQYHHGSTLRIDAVQSVNSVAQTMMDTSLHLNIEHRKVLGLSEHPTYECGQFKVLGGYLFWLDDSGRIVGAIEKVLPADAYQVYWPHFSSELASKIRDLLPQLRAHSVESEEFSNCLRQSLHLGPCTWSRIGKLAVQYAAVHIRPPIAQESSSRHHHGGPRSRSRSPPPSAAAAASASASSHNRQQQYILVTAGPVGAGKSWFANKLVDQSQGSWVRANQDDLGSRDEVARVAREALLAGHSALIDRTNFDVSQRSHWFNLARECGVPMSNVFALWFDIPPTRCATRLSQRVDHPNLGAANVELAHRVLRFFLASLVPPSVAEGFAQVHVVQSDEEVAQAVTHFANMCSKSIE